ncbi:DUF2975 domain-containing protein [Sphingomonas faeni]|uniref:DUF2975 domain-containing protein n=1 Tax=Sphingomonas faeni TaxID=185950 RepID=UPI002788FEF2|nr:DUF2975 domain-containing protein [Sphingomonas faeni]MDQ0839081.1 hypothetical protein [Sphingomonas faeni]
MQDRGLGLATGLLRVATWANWLLAGIFVVAIGVSFAFGDAFSARLLTKYPGSDAGGIVAVMRGMAMLGILAAVAMHRILAELSAIVLTVRLGDPFVVANADRLRRVGWALLILQLLDLAVGLVVYALDKMGVDHATWTPAFTGWIAVAMIFVLARVFRVGAGMRDDLDMTV